jgi:pyruvate,water dikinase
MDNSVDNLLYALKERAKELNCLYEVEGLFRKPDASLPSILQGIVRAIPAGWQFPNVCQARITYGEQIFESPDFQETPWVQSADIRVEDEIVGKISVFYIEERPLADEGPFLREERKLIDTIADRVQRRIFFERLKAVFEKRAVGEGQPGPSWAVLDLLKRTDLKLLRHITRKMLNFLSWSGLPDANTLLETISPATMTGQDDALQALNRPSPSKTVNDLSGISDEVFRMANGYLGEREVLDTIQKWIMEDRSNFLFKVLEDPASTLAQIANAIERFHHLAPHGLNLPMAREKGFRVSLIRKLLNDDLHFINIAKKYLGVDDFHDLLRHIISPAGSQGKLGGKGSGLFLASKILKKSPADNDLLQDVRTPKTWYITSDGIMNFISHNDLEEIVEQRYEDITRIRQEYPDVVHLFKNSPLPPEIVNALSVALDDLGDCPLIVRSSSLLEDRMGASFAGKYKSLFIANQGAKQERLRALMDAITEVYASIFSPDPIEYRIEHGMIDFNEEMGILIQEVVGKKVGHYFFPAFAGVAFSRNEFRWSQRIRREDGLVRMVPGLGTRAVDRLSDDYPILATPGQPNLRVNVTNDEKIHYSPKKIDVINLKTNSFETIEILELLRRYGDEYPLIDQIGSVCRDERLEPLGRLGTDFEKDHIVLTFEGLIKDTAFMEQIRSILKVLENELATPVDIEFAHDGTNLYLLQCRPQSSARASQPAAIPRDMPTDRILFTANRFITNGTVSGITHIVYVDPQRYGELQSRSDLLAVGRAVSKLNQMLPKRQFILMGPGRWGSRGDIKLGVSVSYSDISNTAMIVEIARKQKDYVPELSFGTHFFQDLVEASIRYLPLYPDDRGVVFNEEFLVGSKNILADILPEYSSLSDTIRVIEVADAANGQVLQVLMNGERDEAVALLVAQPDGALIADERPQEEEPPGKRDDAHWRWRLSSVERMAARMDAQRFGVKAFYIFGSTKNATAGPQSDIDILVYFDGTEAQRKDLMSWLEGWSLCLSETNYLRTGHKTDGLLDIHIVTDEDIKRRTSFASKIGAITDPPRLLRLGKDVIPSPSAD